MPRPPRTEERRQELLPALATAFAELGYHRATTAVLARRCGTQEAILYRLWADKRAMFVAALEFVASNSLRIWAEVLARPNARHTPAERLLAFEARHLGEFGLYRLLFAGWAATDDPVIRAALARVYRTFVDYLAGQVADHRRQRRRPGNAAEAERTAWAILGVGTAANLGRELALLPASARRRLLAGAGRRLLD